MAYTLKKVLVRGLPLALLALSASSFAGEDPWSEAFPESCDQAGCSLIQGGLGVAETAAGAKFLLTEGARPRGPLAGDPHQVLDRSARLAAVEEVTKADPKAAALLAEKQELEILKLRVLASHEDPAAMKALQKSPAMHDFESRLAALEERRPEIKQLERKITSRAEDLMKAAKKGQTIPASMGHAADYWRNFKPATGLQIAIGVGLLADGGARLLGVLQQRDPGYLPAVSVGVTAAKHYRNLNKPEANEGAETTMEVK